VTLPTKSSTGWPTHECPAPGCTIMVPKVQLACRSHWFSIPQEIRSRLWAAWRSHDEIKHAQALRDCIAFLTAPEVPA
jgi:hypothetical protein